MTSRSTALARLVVVALLPSAVFFDTPWPAQACSFLRLNLIWPKNVRSSHALFRFVEDDKVGFIDADGRIVIPPRFDDAGNDTGDFIEGLASVRLNGYWGYIGPSGEFAVPAIYSFATDFQDGFALVHKSIPGSIRDQRLYVDTSGEELSPADHVRFRLAEKYPAPQEVPNELNQGRYGPYAERIGYVDRQGRFVVPAEFAVALAFSEELAAVALDGHCYVSGEGIFARGAPPSLAGSSCGTVVSEVSDPCLFGFIDPQGEYAIPARFERARSFDGGLAAVLIGGRWGLIDRRGEFAVAPQFEAIGDFREGLATAKKDGLWGFIDRTGRFLVDARFTEVAPFHNGLAEATDEKERVFQVDRAGRLTPVASDFLLRTRFIFGLSHVRLGKNRWGYIRPDGAVVFEYIEKDNILGPGDMPDRDTIDTTTRVRRIWGSGQPK